MWKLRPAFVVCTALIAGIIVCGVLRFKQLGSPDFRRILGYMIGERVIVCTVTRPEGDVQTIMTHLQMYKTLTGAFPSTAQGVDALVAPPVGNPQPNKWRRLMEAVPLDPWGNAYQIRNPATKSKAGIDLFSMGPDGKPDTDDDIGNWQLQD